MAWRGHRERVPMMALRIVRAVVKHASEGPFGAEIVAKADQVVLTHLIDAHNDDQLGPVGGARGCDNERQEDNSRQGHTVILHNWFWGFLVDALACASN